MMKKEIFVDKSAKKELSKFSEEVREEFDAFFDNLREKGKLEFPEAKKVSKNLFEIRVKFRGEYRGFYAYADKVYIVILHIFKKKTKKTPLKNLRLAERRLKKYG